MIHSLPALTCVLILLGQAPHVQPTPQEITYREGATFALPPGAPIVIPDDFSETERRMLDAILGEWDLPVVRAGAFDAGAAAIYIGERERNAAIDHRRVSRALTSMRLPEPEGYRLAITEEFIVVSGGGPQGTFYGLQTLKQLAGPSKIFPVVTIRDQPDVIVRGLLLHEPAAPDELARLAALKCNLILYDSPEFSDLRGPSAETWKRAFQQARDVGIEPVPVLDFIANGSGFLRDHPEWAEGLTAEEIVVLEDGIAAQLGNAHVLASNPGDIVVRYNGRVCVPGDDYRVIAGETAYPYTGTKEPWRIARTPASAIPPGAPVAVRYAYAPPRSQGLRPAAPGLEAAIRDAVQRVEAILAPRLVHLGGSLPARLATDPRSNDTNPETWLVEGIRLVGDAVENAMPDAGVMAWTEAFAPQPAMRNRESVPLPDDIVLCVRDGDNERRDWAMGTGRDVLLESAQGPSRAYENAKRVAQVDRARVGVFTSLQSDIARAAHFESAWSSQTPFRPWPEVWNRYFNVDLWMPNYDDTVAAMAAHLDTRSWLGRAPDAEFDDFERTVRDIRERSTQDLLRADTAYGLYENLTEYVALEAAFAASGDPTILSDVAAIVERHGAYAPNWPDARTQSILETMQRIGDIVPSTLLFGSYLAPYRSGPPVGAGTPRAVAAAPTYRDGERTIVATFDLLQPGVAIYRAEFNSIGLGAIALEASDDGSNWTVLDTRPVGSPPRAPLQLTRPANHRFWRVSAETAGQSSALRDARLVALTPEPVAEVDRIAPAGTREDTFNAVTKLSPSIRGFLTANETLTENPVLVRVAYDGLALYLTATLADTRPDTIVAEPEGAVPFSDGHERLEVQLQGAGERVFTFTVTPDGASGARRGRDTGWRGDWTAQASRTPTGWTANLWIPASDLGWETLTSRSIPANVIRIRRNVTNEDSGWAGTRRDERHTPAGQLLIHE